MYKKVAASHHLKKQPDEILREYVIYETNTIADGLSVENWTKSRRKRVVEMMSDRIFTSEVDANLWERALVTAIGDINHSHYPHHSVVKKIINHTLNSHNFDIGLTKNFFVKLILFHPPSKSDDLQKYYWSLLEDRYLVLNPVKVEEESVFWCLIDVLSECLANEEYVKGCREKSSDKLFTSERREMTESMVNLSEKMLAVDSNLVPSCSKKEKSCFASLSPIDQIHRILTVLEFLSSVIEADYKERAKENHVGILSLNKCFFSALLWENPESEELINIKVKKLVHVWFIMEQEKFYHFLPIHRKLLMLLSETVRRMDHAGQYPFLGDKVHSLAGEISLRLGLKGNTSTVWMLRPHWLRMLVCSKLLCHITGNSCPPELESVLCILEYVGRKLERDFVGNNEESEHKKRKKRISADIKSCLCRSEKSRRKLPIEIDINAMNSRGWTVLHEAVLNGHEKCVEKLLKDGKRLVDTRRKGAHGYTPLMCAVLSDDPGISQQLLDHSGPELLTDIDNEGCTAMDLCQVSDVYDVLESFKSGISIKNDEFESCIDLCVQLIVSYFITYRTWDFWKYRTPVRKFGFLFDRDRYKTDVHTSVDRLTKTVTKLMEWQEIAQLLEPLSRLLDLKNTL